MNRHVRIIAWIAGAILSATIATAATTYEYDNLHRLVQATYDNGIVVRYAYDAVGNRTSRTIIRYGDINDDGVVNVDDIPGFVAVLLGLDTSPVHLAGSDIDHSGTADGTDIQAFVGLLLGG